MLSVAENGTTQLASYQYDSLSQRQLLTLGGVTNHKVDYAYSINDRLTDLNQHLGSSTAAFTFDYGYNDSGQLTSLASSDTFYLGKRRTSETYTVNNLNQYETVGSATLNYDPNGNLTQWDSPEYGVQRYSYDIENRLQTAAVNGSATPMHYYDYGGLGRRVYKRTDATLGAGDIFTGGTETFYLLDSPVFLTSLLAPLCTTPKRGAIAQNLPAIQCPSRGLRPCHGPHGESGSIH